MPRRATGTRVWAVGKWSPLFALFDLIELDQQSKNRLDEIGVNVELFGVCARSVHHLLFLLLVGRRQITVCFDRGDSLCDVGPARDQLDNLAVDLLDFLAQLVEVHLGRVRTAPNRRR